MDFTSRVPVVVILKNKKGNIIKRKGHLLNEKGTLSMKKAIITIQHPNEYPIFKCFRENESSLKKNVFNIRRQRPIVGRTFLLE